MRHDRSSLRDLITSAIADVTDVDVSSIDPGADLFEVGIDSLHFTAILIEVEERLEEDISPEAFDRFADIDRFTLDTIADALAGPASAP